MNARPQTAASTWGLVGYYGAQSPVSRRGFAVMLASSPMKRGVSGMRIVDDSVPDRSNLPMVAEGKAQGRMGLFITLSTSLGESVRLKTRNSSIWPRK